MNSAGFSNRTLSGWKGNPAISSRALARILTGIRNLSDGVVALAGVERTRFVRRNCRIRISCMRRRIVDSQIRSRFLHRLEASPPVHLAGALLTGSYSFSMESASFCFCKFASSILRMACTYWPNDVLNIASTGALSTAMMSRTRLGRWSDTAIAVFAPLKPY